MEEAVAIVFPLQNPDADVLQKTLKADDEQALRYVARYVPMVLRRKIKPITQLQSPTWNVWQQWKMTMKSMAVMYIIIFFDLQMSG